MGAKQLSSRECAIRGGCRAQVGKRYATASAQRDGRFPSRRVAGGKVRSGHDTPRPYWELHLGARQTEPSAAFGLAWRRLTTAQQGV